jgi:RNA polymerase primary sigma factor
MDDSRLTNEQEAELAARIQAGDVAARDELVAANEGLAVSLAEHYRGRGVELDDLIQEARMELLNAAADFAPAVHGTRFSTYAGACIRGQLSKYARETARLVRVPTRLQYRVRDFEATTRTMIDEGVESPTFDQVADRLEIPPRHRRTLRAGLDAPKPESIHCREDGGCPAAAVASQEPEPLERLERAEELSALDAALGRLDSFERWVIERRYRLDDKAIGRARRSPGLEADEDELRPFAHLSRECGLSRHILRRIEAEAMAKLRDALDDDAPAAESLILAFRTRDAGPRAAGPRAHRIKSA